MSTLGICLFVFLHIQYVVGAATSVTFTPTSTDNLTCPSRTINYLTHTLLQQCLPSSRTIGFMSSSANSSTTKSYVTTPVPAPSTVKVSTSRAPTPHGSSSSDLVSVARPPTTTSPSLSTSIRSVTTISAATANSLVPVPALPETADEDSPLESGNFLSFEEWKKQNLINAGQSEHLGRNSRPEQREPRQRPGNAHNTLDSLGDDAEIDLDFSGLVPGGPDTIVERTKQLDGTSSDDQEAADAGGPKKLRRGKDAGTTSKERFNYASFDCAANVLKTNQEAKSANTVLSDNKDSYMLNKCSAKNKFIVLELCDDISIDTIVLANFEFFSSSFRTLRVSVSDRYPVKSDKWKTLGIFEARNTREVQAFLVENPVIWARYVKFEFLTHYGNEFYCPVSLIRVHGTTMMEEYKHDLEMSFEDEDDDDESDAIEAPEPIKDEPATEVLDEPHVVEHAHTVDTSAEGPVVDATPSVPTISDECRVVDSESVNHSNTESTVCRNDQFIVENMLLSGNKNVCDLSDKPLACAYFHDGRDPTIKSASSESLLLNQSDGDEKTQSASHSAEQRSSSIVPSAPIRLAERNVSSAHHETKSTNGHNSSVDSKRSTSTGSGSSKANSTTKDATRPASVKQSGSGTQPQPASPTMQESFFKSVQKRLQMLESNSSLSLQYIEDQSKSLRDAFRKVEQRQFIKTSAFLEQLNQTVLNELREFRQQYDQLWQSTVIELELQRERYQLESQAMHARLGVLADELIFQRRVSILQMVLILVCLGLVLFSKGALNNYMELPLVQSVLSRSPSSRWTATPGESNTNTPAIKRSRSANELGSKQGILKRHHRGMSDDSNNEGLSASELYSPPTPVSFDGYSDAEIVKTESRTDDPEFDPVNIERPSTSPPILPSIEGTATPRYMNLMDDVSIESRLLPQASIVEGGDSTKIKIEHASPSARRHLTWDLPE